MNPFNFVFSTRVFGIERCVYKDSFDIIQGVFRQIKVLGYKGVWRFYADGLFVVAESLREMSACFPDVTSVVAFSAKNVVYSVAPEYTTFSGKKKIGG